MDTNQYTEMFLDESRDHLQAVNDNLLLLEKQPEDLSIVEEIFRSAHTLKGMAATMEFDDISSLTHQMENVLDLIRNKKLDVTTEVIDTAFSCLEALEEMVESISEGGTGKKDVSSLVEELRRLETGEPADIPPPAPVAPEPSVMELDEFQSAVIAQAQEQGYHAIQLEVELQEDVLLKGVRAFMVVETLSNLGELIKTIPTVEELEDEQFGSSFLALVLTEADPQEVKNSVLNISEIHRADWTVLPTQTLTAASGEPPEEKPAVVEDVPDEVTEELSAVAEDASAKLPEEPQPEPSELPAETPEEEQTDEQSHQQKRQSSKTIRLNIERIDQLINLFEEVVIDRGRLEEISKRSGDMELIDTVEHLSRVSKDMQDIMLTMRMVPIEQVFNRFPRMIRGLAKELGKKIDLQISGADTELDRTVIDEIGDPLVHLIRNSVDHGVELPEERREKGKPEEGQLSLRAFHRGNQVVIEMEDDGAGIDRDKVLDKALNRGLITDDQAKMMADEEVYALLFEPGFSTAENVSDISGRGVGLDVVRTTIESLGGHISTRSELGKGSKFTIQLPLTLSILATLLVKIQEETYAIPLSSIVETVLLKEQDTMYVKGEPVIDFRGKVIPLIHLDEIFNLKDRQEDKRRKSVVIVRKGDKVSGLVVDSFLGQKEVVLKSLGMYFKDTYAISGATILGDGRISLIIDPNALIK
ncbi:chemotaxis protein CheW [Virgibacillus sediminis]|uniref:Chemotaxis protein CheA n=1 Tax=Virgibacillus sediminis TaxID=202260 RepID=A0ABV7A473_9BACI